MTKAKGKPKLKVMKVVRAETMTPESRPEQEHKDKREREPKNGEMLEKALQALRDMGSRGTSPQLVKALHFEGEGARDKARRLMDQLVLANKVKVTKLEKTDEIGRRGQFVYEAVGVAT